MAGKVNASDASPIWKKHLTYIRDAVFIILFCATLFGWLRSSVVNRTRLEDQVEIVTLKIEENTKQLEKINDILIEQQVLNGKIIQYMEMDSKR
jgi:hypothetical protein